VGRELDPEAVGDHLDRLYRAAWALCGSREDAEDLVQETYARVLSRPRLLRERDDLGYLLRTLRNTFLDQMRQRSRRPVAASVALDDIELVDTREDLRPEQAIETHELFAVIAALPPDFRDVLVAVDVAGLSYKETAAALRIRTGTVMSRLYRARERVANTPRVSGIEPAEQTS
jgi:RNA polymerase sigma-70 factor (ECF subfamily)